MSNVTVHVDPETDVAMLVAVGRITPAELTAAAHDFYASDPPKLLLLCDLSQADLGLFSADDITLLVKFTESRATSRRGGRTAIVAGRDLEFGLSRMYSILADLHTHPLEIRPFRDKAEALAWLLDRP